MCCYRYRLLFNCCFEDINISLGSVATHLRFGRILNDVVTTPDSVNERILKIG